MRRVDHEYFGLHVIRSIYSDITIESGAGSTLHRPLNGTSMASLRMVPGAEWRESEAMPSLQGACRRREVPAERRLPHRSAIPPARASRPSARWRRKSGATPRALRFYESKGLLSPQRQGAARLTAVSSDGSVLALGGSRRPSSSSVDIRRMLGISAPAEFGAAPSHHQAAVSSTRSSCSSAKARDRAALAESAPNLFVFLCPLRRARPSDLPTLLHLAPDAPYIRVCDSPPGEPNSCRATRRLSMTCSSC